MHNWLWENPWELRISLSFLFQINEQTWLCVFTLFRRRPVSVFQNFMVLSVVPPPVANSPLCHGHQAKAFTAALWPWRTCLYFPVLMSQIMARLSLLPEASPQGSCLSPQTSPLCPSNLMLTLLGLLTSCPKMEVSLEPENSTDPKLKEETRLKWPLITLSNDSFSKS